MSNADGIRQGIVKRATAETNVEASVKLDGTGIFDIATGNGTLDHLLAQLSRHGLFDINIQAKGDIETGWHHLVEDVGITLGRAFREAVGDGEGIIRMGHSLVPLDESLAQVVVDLSGRGYASIETGIIAEKVEHLPSDLIRHSLEAFAVEGRMTLHVKLLTGINDHHKAEAIYKGLARALRDAVQIEPRLKGAIPSTKGSINS